ncbi:substrate-binding domain-containing protein, partial [Nocardioides sp.]|uniref:substrate-binding domain-containing protein n=1 Tax=Nocardioides sp. TaxID=35761 RepID=UPI00273345D3
AGAVDHLRAQSVEGFILIAAHDEALEMARAQETENVPMVVVEGDWTARSGYEAGVEIAGRPEVTAVFAGNDQMALGVLRAVFEAGRRVPRDISVVGFDDNPEAAYLIPPLTTVRQDFTAVGVRAIEVLRGAIASAAATGVDGPPGSLIPPELVVRASTAAPQERKH